MQLLKFTAELSLTCKEDCEKLTLEILKILRPNWSSENVKFQYFSVGITNKIFATQHLEESVIFRVFGKNTGKIIDRDNEIVAWRKLAQHGLAAPLYAQFANGIVCGFLEGESLKIEQMRQQSYQSKIARAISHLHTTIPSDSEPCLFDKIRHFNNAFIPKYDDTKKQQIYSKHFPENLELEIQKLEKLILESDEIVAFCHNDILVHNIVYDPKNDSINFIDYEYASTNYALFDIANHFCEYAGVEDIPDYSQCLKKSQKIEFLEAYLGDKKTPERLDQIMQRIPLFEAASHLFWSIWALVQSQNSVIEFDYLTYGASRYEQYIKRLSKYSA
ncbi:unnamed protein product [Caenorhabditis angaria]|uniref:ethanolamine kinase n=1 Tax=Caenorhabditis angaria TaxID=860376 RepID=A0A9P1NB85_9PELO|nr:unnamed protein product [Caenorhabditis angaria]